MRGDPEVEKVAATVGLPNGRVVSWSKSLYLEIHPDHLIIFNATITDTSRRRLWWGDIDVAVDADRLIGLARALNRRLYLLFPNDAGPMGADEVPHERAVAVVETSGEITFTDRVGQSAGPIERDEQNVGRVRCRRVGSRAG